MSEVKFTKGEWKVTSQFGVSVGEHVGSAVFTQNTGCVTSSVIERESNAHLIAAAPDMYDMLHSIENDSNQIPPFLWDKIQSVLAKARGEHV